MRHHRTIRVVLWYNIALGYGHNDKEEPTQLCFQLETNQHHQHHCKPPRRQIKPLLPFSQLYLSKCTVLDRGGFAALLTRSSVSVARQLRRVKIDRKIYKLTGECPSNNQLNRVTSLFSLSTCGMECYNKSRFNQTSELGFRHINGTCICGKVKFN